MAERSKAMVLRKTGGRQNVVLLCTLKRTRLAKRGHIGIFLDKEKNGVPETLSEVVTYSRAVVAFLQHFP